MRIRVPQLLLPLDHDKADLRQALASRLGLGPQTIQSLRVERRSLDARPRRGKPVFVFTVQAEIPDHLAQVLREQNKGELITEEPGWSLPEGALSSKTSGADTPVIIGAGPAGIMAALVLAEAGLRPRLFERGDPAPDRHRTLARFLDQGELDPDSNVLFGEGGAGLYSDGKLTSRSKDRAATRYVLEALVQGGADPDILVDSQAHLGTDRLQAIVPRLRKRIMDAGGEVFFRHQLEALQVEDGRLRGVTVNGQDIRTDLCILATGHSARDVYRLLASSGVDLSFKPFAAGVRVEIPQKSVDRAQYGKWAEHARLGPASFRLTRKAVSGLRPCYTFCMCPGGSVVACASEPDHITTNGMSLSDRAGDLANAAFLVPVNATDVSDLATVPPLAGLQWQEMIEAEAFAAGGRGFGLPASDLTAFVNGTPPQDLPDHRSCKRSRAADLSKLLPDALYQTLQAAVPRMLGQLKGLDLGQGVVYGVETRSSSPVRILRGEDRQSTSVPGLFPAGEGSGYAGGIMSSAVDGLRTAAAVAERLG